MSGNVSSSVPSRSKATAFTGMGSRTLRSVTVGQRGTHRGDRPCVIRRGEDARTRYERVGPGTGDLGYVVDLDAAVDLQPDVAPELVDAGADRAQLIERMTDELLASEPRVHGHDEHQVELRQNVVQAVERRRRVEHQTGAAARVLD